jgi:ATP-binding cassette subfamily B protein
MSDIVDKGIITGDSDLILSTGLTMLGVTALTFVVIFCTSFLSSQISARFSRDLRKAIFQKVENFSLDSMDSFGIASLITRTINDVNQVQHAVMMLLRMVVMAPVMAVGSAVLAFSKNARLSSVLLISIPILVAGIYFITRKTLPLFRRVQEKTDVINRVLRENLTGIRVIRAFGKNAYEKKRFVRANEELTDTSLRAYRMTAFVSPMMMIVMNATTLALIALGSFQIDSGNLQIGELMAILQYVAHIMHAFFMMSMIFSFLPRAEVSAKRIDRVLSCNSPMDAFSETISVTAKEPYTIEFRNVSFNYPGASESALKGINFTAEAGKTTAIIGSTASGKTTLLNLLMRFYDAKEGEILINGIDSRSIAPESVRSKFGYAPQKAALFSGTLKENIRFGRETITEADIEKAADIAQVRMFSEAMPDKLDSPVAQGGTNLSGGQKQRVSIARAIAGDPPILLFDDTFSALDFKTDAVLRQRLKSELNDKTMILVAQRVATIMDADQIIVLRNGLLAGRGTHEQLMQTCREYKEIVLSQLSEEEIA